MKMIGVFIVCNDLNHFKAVENELHQNNIEVVGMCRTGTEAISLFQPEQTDIVIIDLYWSDINMPAVELMNKLKLQKPILEFIGVTRSFEREAIQDLMALEFRGYISLNPFHLERVLECIADVAAGKVHYNLFNWINLKPIPVLLVVENELYRDLLKSFLNAKLYYCNSSGSLELAETIIDIMHPELVLVDYDARPVNGAYVISSLIKRFPLPKYIGLSQKFAKNISDEFEGAGASAYTWHNLPPASQLKLLDDVNNGKIVIPKHEYFFKFRP